MIDYETYSKIHLYHEEYNLSFKKGVCQSFLIRLSRFQVSPLLGKAVPGNEHGRFLMAAPVGADVVCLGQQRIGKHSFRAAGGDELAGIQNKKASAESRSHPEVVEHHKNAAAFQCKKGSVNHS